MHSIVKMLALVLLAACGDPFALPDATFFGDAPFFPGSDTTLCTSVCSGQCVNLDTDPMHCGLCTRACPSDMPSCVSGTCALADQTTVALHFAGASVAAVALDPAGNLYMTGSFSGTIDLGGGPLVSAGGTDIFIASYTDTGTFRWAKAFGGTGDDAGAGIAISNSVLVAGHISNAVSFAGTMLVSAGGTDIVEIELDPSVGDLFIARSWGTPTDDAAYAITWSVQGVFTIAGAFGAGTLDFVGASLHGTAVATGFAATFDGGGNSVWAQRVDGTAPPFTSVCRAVATDQMGNTVVAGAFGGTGNFPGFSTTAAGTDAFVTSYASFGQASWSRTFGGPDDDVATSVAADPQGNVAVGGSYHGAVDFGAGTIPSTGTLDGFLAGYSVGGNFQFARHLGAATSSSVTGLAIGANGMIVATGSLVGAADFGTGTLAPLGQTDIFVAGFGGVAPRFAKRYGGTDLDSGAAIAAGPSVYVTAAGLFRGTVDLGTGSIAGGAADNGYVIVIAP